ncbi:acyl-CoA dehydrogenase family protein [Variovorax sp. Root434]|uniref:acyl-CoA dehydrogenase family protein n=1 Tax=Variovorax sp. Root434 TaxID=1736536 RepID=UPI000700EFCF|nr:acyl-CoA dehydrogenase family protein [Variovorax sp. Root434]KQX21351.1 acyl-CoA dehydrogenase [Variovorax sp. Root434]
MNHLSFPRPQPSEIGERLRAEVREFIDGWHGNRHGAAAFSGFDPAFSEALGKRGWIGMGFPKRYGGGGYGLAERLVVLEELLAVRAPIFAHAVAERQSGPLLLRFGNEQQREEIVPRIAAGTCYFCIGLSEPDSGSDLASVRTRAIKVDGGWRVNGAKIWTSSAHRTHYMVLLCRTAPASEVRQAGLSQFLVDMKTPGVTCRSIVNIAGDDDFNEVHFQDVFLSDDALIGVEGQGWQQVTSELTFERSGPDRFMSHMGAVEEFVTALKQQPSVDGARTVGRLVAHLSTLRRMSRSIANMITEEQDAALHAALLKDLGTCFEQEIPETLRLVLPTEPEPGASDGYSAALANVILHAPSCTIRGGTKEVLRGMVAKSLGLR